MENIVTFIKPELLILVPVLYLLGVGVKKSHLKDKWIPVVLGVAGVVLAIIYTVGTATLGTVQDGFMAVFVGITQGILVAGGSVYADQVVKQIKK